MKKGKTKMQLKSTCVSVARTLNQMRNTLAPIKKKLTWIVKPNAGVATSVDTTAKWKFKNKRDRKKVKK